MYIMILFLNQALLQIILMKTPIAVITFDDDEAIIDSDDESFLTAHED